MKIHWIQHVAFEGLGNIEEWVENNGYELTCTRQFKGDILPDLNAFDLLIVMGGPMGVYDFEEYPWIKHEAEFIRACIQLGKPILGICLGSQFIASALGAKVYPGPCKEIGWYPLSITADSVLGKQGDNVKVFHWHGDTFDLPIDAQLLASTDEVVNQAYKINNNVIGLQFHLEQTTDTIDTMLLNCSEEIAQGGDKVQTDAEIRTQLNYFESNKRLMFSILDFLIKT
ncbi:glutamine amidotransferase-related protein [Saccharicrinis aurantiacus]|uniref:glutamine amidotransferase-related protein n=1 Tax=Saccharicrinis aurantiacus TaxID=1849719 RepID=UPI000838FC9F|nr:gamma-glutamyl-gamma-aminobutyrate hydrolase family protein [Saccharicrinis aurantiacus]